MKQTEPNAWSCRSFLKSDIISIKSGDSSNSIFKPVCCGFSTDNKLALFGDYTGLLSLFSVKTQRLIRKLHDLHEGNSHYYCIP